MEAKSTNYPVTLNKDINNILLSWDNVEFECKTDVEYNLFMKEQWWKKIYRGTDEKYLVKHLAPSNCYTFKLEIMRDNNILETIQFRAATDFEPYSVFHMTRALKQSKTPLLRKVINQRPALLELENKDLKTPLMYAVEKGDLQLVTLLTILGANINNSLLTSKRTPLMMALYYGNLQIARLLIDKGANIHLKDCNGLTALHYAIDSDSIKNVEFALQQHFDINDQDNSGWSPLLRAVILECSDEVIMYLLKRGADTLIKDKNGFDFPQHSKLVNREYLLNIANNKTPTTTENKEEEP